MSPKKNLKLKNIWYEINDSQTNCIILITYKINKDPTNQSANDTKEIQKPHELIKHKKISNNIKSLNQMPKKDIAKVFTQKNQAGRQLWIKNSYNRIKYTKDIYRQIYIKKPVRSQ